MKATNLPIQLQSQIGSANQGSTQGQWGAPREGHTIPHEDLEDKEVEVVLFFPHILSGVLVFERARPTLPSSSSSFSLPLVQQP